MLAYYAHFLCIAFAKWSPALFSAVVGAEHGGDGAAHDGGGHHDGPPHLPSLVGMLTGSHGFWYDWVNVIYAFFVAIILCIVAVRVYGKRTMIPGPFQNAIEFLVEGFYDFFSSILGRENARRYTPFLGTLFFYILFMNWIGLVPLGHSPSTSWSTTAALAIIVFLYVQFIGIQKNGILGYLDHFAGQPRDAIGWGMVILMFPLHIIGELAKPLSLSLRLFGNITGEDVLIAVFVGLGIASLSFINSPVGLPLQTPFILLGLLLSAVQALVFTLLSTIYILLMLPHDEHEEAHEH